MSSAFDSSTVTPRPSSSYGSDFKTTAFSPIVQKAGPEAATPKTWSKDEAAKLLKLFFRSLFFVLPKAGFEASQIAVEACKKVVIQNLIERVLVGVNLDYYTAGGFWRKTLTAAIKSRVDAAGAAGQALSCFAAFPTFAFLKQDKSSFCRATQ
jgi:hypothetical protein